MTDYLVAVAGGALAGLDDLAREHAHAARFTTGDVTTPEALARTTAGADALIVSLHRLTAEHVAALPETVRVIGRAGVGLDTIDVDAAAARGIPVIYQPEYATAEVADHAMAMLLAAQRRITAADCRIRAEGWFSGADLGPVLALQDATAAIVGTGRIGRAVADRLLPFVDRLVGYDLPGVPPHPTVEIGSDLAATLRVAQLVTLHLPLTPQTRHIIGADELAILPAGSVLVNVSRGGLVDEEALAEALCSGQLGGAALDVFESEPLAADSPLRDAPNLTLSPHIAWYSSQSGPRLAGWTAADVLAVLDAGRPVRGRIAPPSGGAARVEVA